MSSIAQHNRRSQSTTAAGRRLNQKPRVLIVDDDRSTALSLTADFEVVQVTDGDKAYRLLRASDNFDVIVLNPKVKGISGVDLLRHMKSENRLKRIPVIVAVAEDGSRLITEAFAAGAVASLYKPFTQQVLWRTLSMVLPADIAKPKAA